MDHPKLLVHQGWNPYLYFEASLQWLSGELDDWGKTSEAKLSTRDEFTTVPKQVALSFVAKTSIGPLVFLFGTREIASAHEAFALDVPKFPA
jgi:hypothetical protein